MVEQTEYCLDLSTGLRLGVPLGKLKDPVSGRYLELVMANWKEWRLVLPWESLLALMSVLQLVLQLVCKMAAKLVHSYG